MKKLIPAFALMLLAAACSHNKKMIVMSKGPALVNNDAATIQAKDGSGHEEKEVALGSNANSFSISSPAGDGKLDLTGSGLFVVNAKSDTIIGGFVAYGDPRLANHMVTQEDLKKRIDSLQLLIDGKNTSAANRNFYILPNTAVKISDNVEAMVVGPYHRMRSAETVNGKAPEVYRFYSIKEEREMLANWIAMTVAEKK